MTTHFEQHHEYIYIYIHVSLKPENQREGIRIIIFRKIRRGGRQGRDASTSYARSRHAERLGALSLESDEANTGCIQRGGAHTMVFQKDNAKDGKYSRSKAHFNADMAATPLQSTIDLLKDKCLCVYIYIYTHVYILLDDTPLIHR